MYDAKIKNDGNGNLYFYNSREHENLPLIHIDYCKKHPKVYFQKQSIFPKWLHGTLYGDDCRGKVIVKDGVAIVGKIEKVVKEEPIKTKKIRDRYYVVGGKIEKEVNVVLVPGTKVYLTLADPPRVLTKSCYSDDDGNDHFNFYKSKSGYKTVE
jgi:hypothetical protein